ncbi:MAG: efflux RND transporter periplasmic adaptor subunit [Bacteroidota bacterium]
MKKVLVILTGLLLITACKNEEAVIKEKIDKNKDEIHRLEMENKELMTKLPDSTKVNGVPVELKTMNYDSFEHFFEVSGMVESLQDAYISPEIGGQIKNIHVVEGQRVKKGDLLVTLNTSVTRNSIDEVKTGLELAKQLYEKQKALWDQNIGSEMQYLEAKNRKEQAEARLNTLESQLAMSLIRAPFDGIINKIFQKEGELGAPGARLMQVVNLNNLKMTANITEIYIQDVEKGANVLVSFPNYPEITREIPIYRTSSVLDRDSRTFEIELRMKNMDERIKPNSMSIIRINDYSSDSALVVPSIIIKRDFKGSYVYTAKESGKKMLANKVYIKTGKSFEDLTELKAGINPGDRIIVKGYNQVSDGTVIIEK